MSVHWFWLATAALVFWGITGVTQKLSTNRISAQLCFLGFSAAFLPIALIIVVFFPRSPAPSAPVVVLGVLGGVFNGLGALTSFKALESGGKASVVIPIVALYPLVTVLGSFLFFREQLTPANWAGIVLAPLAAWMLSAQD